jgi:hypothetical protein
MIKLFFLLFLINFLSLQVFAKEFRTNELEIHNAPDWLMQPKVEKVTDSIQQKLEWRIRRIPLFWHQSESSFVKAQTLGPTPAAVTIKSKQKTEIHMGPQVNKKNYEQILGHELVHVIFYQKYNGAIPQWLEEGFANDLSKKEAVNYKWLSQQKIPEDVTKMGHPFKGIPSEIHTQYKVSQALVEMLKKKCDLENLLRLSVERKMTDYIKTYCEIKDINQSFKEWILKKI